MEITVCRETARAAASSACDSPRWVRRSRTRFCTMSRYLYLIPSIKEALLTNGCRGVLARRLSGCRAAAGNARPCVVAEALQRTGQPRAGIGVQDRGGQVRPVLRTVEVGLVEQRDLRPQVTDPFD